MENTEVKVLDSEDFAELTALYVNLKEFVYSYYGNTYVTIKSLISDSCQEGFLALGLYHKKILVGFLTGYRQSKEEFFISSLFIKDGHTKSTPLLIEYSLFKMKKLGYKQYFTNCNNRNIESIISKLGAKMVTKQYVGDVEWEATRIQ